MNNVIQNISKKKYSNDDREDIIEMILEIMSNPNYMWKGFS